LVVEPTHLKNVLVKLGIFPKWGMKDFKKIEPPPSITIVDQQNAMTAKENPNIRGR